MIRCQTKQWGNSLGLIIPREEVLKYKLKPQEELFIEITSKTNVLKDLFGVLKFKKPTAQVLKEARAEVDSKL